MNRLHEDFAQEMYDRSTSRVRFIFGGRQRKFMEARYPRLFKKQSGIKKYRIVELEEENGDKVLVVFLPHPEYMNNPKWRDPEIVDRVVAVLQQLQAEINKMDDPRAKDFIICLDGLEDVLRESPDIAPLLGAKKVVVLRNTARDPGPEFIEAAQPYLSRMAEADDFAMLQRRFSRSKPWIEKALVSLRQKVAEAEGSGTASTLVSTKTSSYYRKLAEELANRETHITMEEYEATATKFKAVAPESKHMEAKELQGSVSRMRFSNNETRDKRSKNLSLHDESYQARLQELADRATPIPTADYQALANDCEGANLEGVNMAVREKGRKARPQRKQPTTTIKNIAVYRAQVQELANNERDPPADIQAVADKFHIENAQQ